MAHRLLIRWLLVIVPIGCCMLFYVAYRVITLPDRTQAVMKKIRIDSIHLWQVESVSTVVKNLELQVTTVRAQLKGLQQ